MSLLEQITDRGVGGSSLNIGSTADIGDGKRYTKQNVRSGFSIGFGLKRLTC